MAVWSEATAPSCYDHTFAAAFQPLYIYIYLSGTILFLPTLWVFTGWRPCCLIFAN